MDLPFLLLSQENKKLQRHLKPTILSSVYLGYEEEIMPYLGKIQHYPHFSPKKLGKRPVLFCSEEPWYNVNVEIWATTHTTMDTRGNKNLRRKGMGQNTKHFNL